jgi:hypothetical protein
MFFGFHVVRFSLVLVFWLRGFSAQWQYPKRTRAKAIAKAIRMTACARGEGSAGSIRENRLKVNGCKVEIFRGGGF